MTMYSLGFRVPLVSAIFAFLLVHSSIALADCSEAKIKRLHRSGETVNSIARSCKMDKDDVREVLGDADEQEDPDPVTTPRERPGLPAGAQLSGCGCWGFADTGGISDQRCRSGMARPVMCNAMCPLGGYAWRGICS